MIHNFKVESNLLTCYKPTFKVWSNLFEGQANLKVYLN